MAATASKPTHVSPGLPKCKVANKLESKIAAGQNPMPCVNVN
jgi:hypothetical protein